jgi:hypothetical protein
LTAAVAAAIGAGQARTCLFRDYNAPALIADRGTGDSKNSDISFYLRDRFTVGDHWTFNLGLRYEDMEGQNDIGRTVFESQHVSPRLAATYDIKGDGRQILSLNTGRYYAQLNQQWTNEHLQDKWGGYAEYDDYLFCDAFDAAIGLCSGVGYNFLLRSIRPGEMWDYVDAGIFPSEIDPYYKDEIILGWEWQFSDNWALDTKAIWWELGDMIGATTQLGPTGGQFNLTANYNDYPDILRALEAARQANGLPEVLTEQQISQWKDGKKEYMGLQIQLNRRFNSGWALYNNITFSETETTGSGSWWNNTNDSYGENFHTVLTQAALDTCNVNQARPDPRTGLSRAIPVDCNVLQPFLGQSVSQINRFGNEGTIDRPVIFNSFGFKTWSLGSHGVTLGGHLSFQSGTAWGRSEGVGTIALDGNTARDDSVSLQLEQVGDRRTPSTYQMNLSASWDFPLGSQLGGTFRVEGLNVTNEQERVFATGRGEVRPVRRDFQRPRQFRASLAFKW